MLKASLQYHELLTNKFARAGRKLAAHAPERWMRPISRAHEFRRRRFRGVRAEWSQLIRDSERWTREQLEIYMFEQLRELLWHAYEYVPYYRSMFESLDACPTDIQELNDLHLLPTLAKRTVQDRIGELLATDIRPRHQVYSTTAGSTGIPVGFFQHRDTAAKDWAFMTEQWRRVGYEQGDRAAVLRGTVLRSDEIFERAPLENSLVMSSYHLTEDRLPLYVARLRDFRPAFLRAYPSSATLLAQFILSSGESPPEGMKAVLCGSENLYPWQRQQIVEAFGCRVFSWYGQSERVCLAGECEFDTRLHIFPQYGITELLDEDGEPIREAGRLGEVVATGLLNPAMPLIRYRTGDVASMGNGFCNECGRPYDLIERVEGRLQEFIVSRSGRYVSMTAINMHSPVFDNVYQFRFRQNAPGRVMLLVVPKGGYEKVRDEPAIRMELAPKLGPDFDLDIEVVDQIPRTGRGKFRFLDQELPGPFTAAS